MQPPPPAVRVALGLLVADGLVALYLGELLGPLGLAIAGAGVVASYGGGWLRARLAARGWLGRLVVPAAAAASILDVMVLATIVLDALARLVCFLVVYKLFTLRTVRDSRVIGFLAFFMLVAASSSAFGVGFLFVFVGFVVLATWLAVVQQMLVEAEPAPDRTVVGPTVRGRSLTALAGGAALAALLVTGLFFFVIPRVGLGALPFRARTGPLMTGFSERVELGAYGEIETDDTVVMRVSLPDWVTEPDRLPGLRWRGVALDTYSGGAWTVARPARAALPRGQGNEYPVGIPRSTGRILVQEVYLEPLGSDVIFATPRVLHLRVRGAVQMDGMGGFMVPSPIARLSYTVYSELDEGVLRSWARPAPPLDDAARPRYLQLPRLSPRVAALAREVAADSPDPLETARRLTTFLARQFRYTLSLERVTALDPVEEFLFVRRAGNCEYFAASLAVMLRSLGIPARVVNGFQRGEWNPYGRYYMVRLRDAHSWVEAWTGREGWVTLDPSPRVALSTTDVLGSARLYLDSLRLRWHRYVINWSLRDQMQVAWAIRRQATFWRSSPLAQLDELPTPGLVVAALAVLCVGAVRWARHRRRSADARPAATAPPAFYARALRRLGRRGLRPAPSETAREFAGRVARQAPGCGLPFAAVTAVYERCRFAGLPLAPGDAADVDAALAALDRGIATPRPSD
jgi:transglutaminase-like putative cysteine protease